ncbi:MAG: hypothetical protein ACKVH8_19590 [Pirellulales bacterium]
MDNQRKTSPDLEELVRLFYDRVEDLGQFEEVAVDQLPETAQTLLAHHSHMTVTVERFHNSPVDVKVLERQTSGNYYSRKILLNRQSDGQVVQYGIVRLNSDYLDDEVEQEIKSESIPLGRVLINHNVLREVQLVGLWRINPNQELRSLFNISQGQIVYGRTALIYCNGEPAIELLEIVTPAE